jgi:hypothetical protein
VHHSLRLPRRAHVRMSPTIEDLKIGSVSPPWPDANQHRVSAMSCSYTIWAAACPRRGSPAPTQRASARRGSRRIFPDVGIWTLGYRADVSAWTNESMRSPIAGQLFSRNSPMTSASALSSSSRTAWAGILVKQILRHVTSFGVDLYATHTRGTTLRPTIRNWRVHKSGPALRRNVAAGPAPAEGDRA